jgi:sensor histidine kinase YesM
MPPPQRPSAFRRRLIIYPSIQIPLIAWTAGLALVGALFTASFIVYTQNHPDQNEAMTKIVFMIVGLLIFSSYAILLSYYTNRLFGPIYRLQVTMKKMAEGEDLSPIRLRDGDHFAEVIDEYNRMLEARIPKK